MSFYRTIAPKGATPLFVASLKGRKEVCELLLWRGARLGQPAGDVPSNAREQLLLFARAVTVETTAAFRCLLLCLRRSLPGWRASGQVCDWAGNPVSPIPSYLMRRIRSFLLPGPEGMAAFASVAEWCDYLRCRYFIIDTIYNKISSCDTNAAI